MTKNSEIIRLLKDGFVHGAKTGKYKATALVYDTVLWRRRIVKSRMPWRSLSTTETGYSIVVIFPYRLDNGKPLFQPPVAQKGEEDIFPAI
jgi:hypothetical protein